MRARQYDIDVSTVGLKGLAYREKSEMHGGNSK